MAKKKIKHSTEPGQLPATGQADMVTAGAHAGASSPGSGAMELKLSTHLLIAAGIAILLWLFLKVCLGSQFTGWDDPGYIQDNSLIKDLSPAGLKAIFSTPVMGNYHPLAILSYAIEYSIVGLEPWLYHFDSLVLHILDTLLVYWLINLLSRRPVAAAVTALLFGLHPMHVESLAWVSGRKDVLYALFYFLACIGYVYYLRAEGSRRSLLYGSVLLLFICSALAKPVAVTLPLTLLLIDYFERRDWKINVVIEKIPHFLIALTFGFIAVKVQHSVGAMDMHKEHYSILERVALGSYAFVTYLWKAVLPVGLRNYYVYPQKVNGGLPFLYYLCPIAVVGVIFLLWKFCRKNRVVIFGSLFFIANIALLLQFIPVGGAILADRYSYIPYLGLFFIAGWYISEYLVTASSKAGKTIAGGAVVYIGCLFFMSNERCGVWYDSTTLWMDAIEKDPSSNPTAYNNLGYIYYQKWLSTADPYEKRKSYDSAILLLNKAIEIKPDFANPYISLGEMERGSGQYADARNNYFNALKHNPKDPNIILGLAILYYIMKDMDSSALWFRTAIDVDPSAQAYGNYANFLNLTGKQDSALIIYNISIAKLPDMYASYLNRSKVYRAKNMLNEAIADLDKAIRLNPDVGELYYERSLSLNQKGEKAMALKDVEKAIALGYNKVDNNYYQGLKQ